ncbi:FAD:protein FMN transferase [Defluviitalea saccharophila]|uniref:FAD:protein FMN transferase n=1 Tax=Defluviitalea saccharophila TaxID=879970 RepID=A0ABZ2Y2T1_9FIRM
MKKNIFLMLLITIIAILSGCASNKGKNTVIKEEIYALGTVIQIQIYDADEEKAKKAIEESEKRVQEIENKMTVNKEKSEVILINENSGINSVQVSPDTFYVIQKAKKYSDLSGGAFDLTVEPIVKLWGIGTENARVPKQEEIDALLGLVDYNDVVLDESTNQVKLNREGQAIDLGAIAKGYAGDEVKKILKEHGIKTAFVNLGGNVVTLGSKLDGSPWRIGVQNPLDERGKHIAVIEVVDETLVTSGNYERYFIEDGKRYHHIIDPKTGYPAEAGIISSTIVTNSSIDADALSTSVYVLGLEKGMELIESLENVEAVIVTEDKKIYVTSGLKDRFKLENEEFQLAN